jgi:hypothetical protein
MYPTFNCGPLAGFGVPSETLLALDEPPAAAPAGLEPLLLVLVHPAAVNAAIASVAVSARPFLL